MRRIVVIIAAVVGSIVVLAGAVLFYAAMNLNSIIAERRQIFLDKVSASLGRPVHAADIKATLGWGIDADITGVVDEISEACDIGRIEDRGVESHVEIERVERTGIRGDVHCEGVADSDPRDGREADDGAGSRSGSAEGEYEGSKQSVFHVGLA